MRYQWMVSNSKCMNIPWRLDDLGVPRFQETSKPPNLCYSFLFAPPSAWPTWPSRLRRCWRAVSARLLPGTSCRPSHVGKGGKGGKGICKGFDDPGEFMKESRGILSGKNLQTSWSPATFDSWGWDGPGIGGQRWYLPWFVQVLPCCLSVLQLSNAFLLSCVAEVQHFSGLPKPAIHLCAPDTI